MTLPAVIDDNASEPLAAEQRGASGLPANYRRVAGSGYLLTGVTMIVALFSTPLLARGLGPEGFGVWSIALAAVSYLEVLELGFGGAALALVSARAATGDRRGVQAVVATSFWVLSLPGLAALGLGGLGAALAPRVLDLPAHQVGPARVLIVAFALDLALSIPSDTFGGVLGGFQRLDLVAFSLTVIIVLQGLGWVFVLALNGGLLALGLTTAGISVAGQFVRFLMARRVAGPLPLSPSMIQRGLILKMSKLSGWFAVSDLNRIVVQRIDVLLVAAIVGVIPAGIYAAGQKLALLVVRVAEPLSASLFPQAARLSSQRDSDGLLRALVSSLRVTAAVTIPLATAIACFARPLLTLWAGNDYAGAASIVAYLALGGIVGALATVAQQLLKGAGQVRRAGEVALLESGINITASVVLGMSYGAAGIALATLIASSVSVLVAVPLALRSVAAHLASEAARLVKTHVLSATPACLLALGFSLLNPRPGLLVLPEVAAVGLLHLVALARFDLSGSERSLLGSTVRSKLPFGRVGAVTADVGR